ncbi:MAG: TetR/AcrR family transcriptional regulator [Pseudomonadota bacterium]
MAKHSGLLQVMRGNWYDTGWRVSEGELTSDGTTATSKKDQVVRGAFDALLTHGLGNLSYDHVAEKSGMSRQLVRHYFPDQDALMVDVCNYLASLYQEPLIAAASSLEGPQRISMFLDFYFDLLSDMPKPRDDQAYTR